MSALDDPQYLQLYHDYARAIQAFENATNDRRRVRSRITAKRPPVVRRPVGSPPGTRIPNSPAPAFRSPSAAARPQRVYLGDILGWVTIKPSATVVPEASPVPDMDVDRLYGQISLQLYWNAKIHYQKCKRAFFDYVRRQNVDLHKDRAKAELGHGANLQLLGADDSDDPEFWREAKKEIDAACRNAWALYQTAGAKKSTQAKKLLIQSIADAQYFGLESPTVKAMTSEMYRLISAGEVSK